MRLDAYYYGFDPTGEEPIDRILSAVACAGKAYHHTQSWDEPCHSYEEFLRGETPIGWIQNAATDAAAEMARLRKPAPLSAEERAALGYALSGMEYEAQMEHVFDPRCVHAPTRELAIVTLRKLIGDAP